MWFVEGDSGVDLEWTIRVGLGGIKCFVASQKVRASKGTQEEIF